MAVVGSRRPIAHWPLTVVIGGFPLWWALGLAAFLPVIAAVPMLWQLLDRHPARLPRGYVWWLLFLVWVALGLIVLFADAPGAAPGGGGARVLVFGYRLAMYLACTVVLVWLGNADRTEISDRRVHGLMALFCGYAVAGGFLGLLAPTLEFRTPFELVLPHGIASNGFVSTLVHAEVADVQEVLGRSGSRPKAPFPYTNTWGSVVSLSLVFLIAFFATGRRSLRVPGAVVLLATAVPVVYSLNRGVWAAVAVGFVGLMVIAVAKRQHGMVLVMGAAVLVGAVIFLASPLADLSSERLDHPHSNARRSQLLMETVSSTTQGSPMLGFGSTRNVQGTFTSISGGATPDCPACGVPPLGTQGQLWLVLFSQGWPGLAFFLTFLVLALARSVRCRTVNETICTFVVGIFLLQLAVYDTLGMPLCLVMIAIALVWREQAITGPRDGTTTDQVVARIKRGAPVTVALAVVGASAGWAWSNQTIPRTFESSVAMVITPAPVYLAAGADGVDGQRIDGAGGALSEVTLDTEAALLLSEASLDRASHATGVPASELRPAITLVAEPNTRVLVVTAEQGTPDGAEAAAAAVGDSYLAVRQEHLEQRRAHLVAQLYEELRRLAPGDPSTFEARLRYLSVAIDHLKFAKPTVGYVYRVSDAHRAPAEQEIPAGSGLGIGLLAGVAWAGLRRTVGIGPGRSGR